MLPSFLIRFGDLFLQKSRDLELVWGIIDGMSNDRSSGLVKFLGGLAVGAAAGFLAGILSAEKPGRELRREIQMNSSDFVEGLKDRFSTLKTQASETIEKIAGLADEKIKSSAKNIQTQVDSLGKQLDELTKKQSSARN